MKLRTVFHKVLANPWLYQQCQNAIGGTRARAWTFERYVKVAPGESVLDIGCGPGDSLRLLNLPIGAKYLGVDLSVEYLAEARSRASTDIQFIAGDCTNLQSLIGDRTFNWILCMGLLHHLDDSQCHRLLAQAGQALDNDGTVICLEPTLNHSQGWLTQTVMKRDRGEYVRFHQHWQKIYRQHFDS